MAARPVPWPPIGPPRPPGPPPNPALAAGPRAPQWNPPAVGPTTPTAWPAQPPEIRVAPPEQVARNPGAPAGPPGAQSQAPKPRPPVAAFAVYLQVAELFGNPDDTNLKLQLSQRGWSFLATNERGNVEPQERAQMVKLVVMSRKSETKMVSWCAVPFTDILLQVMSVIRKFPNAQIVVVGKLESGTLENERVKIVRTHDEALQLATCSLVTCYRCVSFYLFCLVCVFVGSFCFIGSFLVSFRCRSDGTDQRRPANNTCA